MFNPTTQAHVIKGRARRQYFRDGAPIFNRLGALARSKPATSRRSVLVAAWTGCVALLLALTGSLAVGEGSDSPTTGLSSSDDRRLWKPVADEMFLQEIGQKIPTETPLIGVAIHDGGAFVIQGGMVKAVQGDKLEACVGAPSGVRRLRSLAGALWALTEQSTYRFDGKQWSKAHDQPLVDLC